MSTASSAQWLVVAAEPVAGIDVIYERFGEAHFFPTIGVAVNRYLAGHKVEWTDGEIGLSLSAEKITQLALAWRAGLLLSGLHFFCS